MIVTNKNIIISKSINNIDTILKTKLIDDDRMTYFVFKNVFKQASIFARICSLHTGDGSHDSNT